jgi:hypothetical protein
MQKVGEDSKIHPGEGEIVPRAWTALVITCTLLGSLSRQSVVRALEPAESPDTTRLIDNIEKTRRKLTPADAEAARRLNTDGDRAYKQGRYNEAFTAYSNSYPNAPNAYAYIMAGDAHWRGVVQYHAAEGRPPAQAKPTCRLDNSYFAHDLAMDVAQHQSVGLTLAAHDHDQRFLASALYRRARESTACLQALAHHYEAEPHSSCVDLGRLRNCLGAPLIK